jgi:hypothetical protein
MHWWCALVGHSGDNAAVMKNPILPGTIAGMLPTRQRHARDALACVMTRWFLQSIITGTPDFKFGVGVLEGAGKTPSGMPGLCP